MNIFHSFESAIKVEKASGYGFAFLGFIFLIICAYFSFYADKNGILVSAKYPCLIAGIFMLVTSPMFVLGVEKKFKTQAEIYQKDKSTFVESELGRNEKLYKGYKNYRLVFAFVGVIAAIATYFFRHSLTGGIVFVVLIFAIYSAFNEHCSFIKVGRYLTELRQWKDLKTDSNL